MMAHDLAYDRIHMLALLATIYYMIQNKAWESFPKNKQE
jgi:hypothetical protein